MAEADPHPLPDSPRSKTTASSSEVVPLTTAKRERVLEEPIKRGGTGESKTRAEGLDRMISQTYRLREDTALRLGKLLVSYKRASGRTKWADFFAHVVDLLEGADPGPPVEDSSVWPGGKVLTPREQRVAEAGILAYWPYLWRSSSFRAAWRGMKSCPYGPERMRLLEAILDDYRQGEIGQSDDVYADVSRSFERKLVHEEMLREYTDAQWTDRGRPLGARREFREALDPKFGKEVPTIGTSLELAGAVKDREEIGSGELDRLPGPHPALTEPKEQQLDDDPRSGSEEETEQPPESDLTVDPKNPEYRRWYLARFGADTFRANFGENP